MLEMSRKNSEEFSGKEESFRVETRWEELSTVRRGEELEKVRNQRAKKEAIL